MGSVESYATSAGKRYRVRYRTPDRRDTQKRGFRTKREAEDYLASVEVAKMRGEWVDASRSRITVGEWAQEWLDAQVQLKPTTLSGYRHALEKHVVPRWGKTRLVDVSHAEVQKWVTGLSTTLGPSAVRQTHLALSGVMKFAIRDGRLARNPCADIRLPRLVKKRRGYLAHEQVAALVAELGGNGDVALFLAYTGLRWGEMAALRVDRVDMVRRRIEVADAVSEPRGQLVWGTPKTHERRSVPFPALLLEPLRVRCAGKAKDDFVFTGADGGVLRGTNFRPRHFEPAIKRLRARDSEFPDITMHDLRHTAASLAISAGANVKAVQRMLGHASAAMTLDVYADLFDDDLDSVADALDRGAREAASPEVRSRPRTHGHGVATPTAATLFD
ncbi:site-specific integrase [Amnibacterium kyonggiense]|uniref:Site-specific recombinase XerD n=1 Tax=Amnibacterium kyonggiense TaxID=595671 RepID=A0A4R7FQF7_9MICO|nr:site-specific integrase [Amnibacterium kyonggiense]TDS80012.1 site-specific recombinase XerD [Amnibacterium kyonggiense]